MLRKKDEKLKIQNPADGAENYIFVKAIFLHENNPIPL